MTYQVDLSWGKSKSTVLASKVALISGVIAMLFAFANTGQSTLLNYFVVAGMMAATLVLATAFLLLSRGAGSRASAGFVGFVITAVALAVAYGVVDPLSTSGSVWQALDIALVLVGDIAPLIGGILLAVSLGSLTGDSGVGRGAGYVFLVGGVLQVASAVPDLADIITGSTSLDNISTALYGVAGIIWVVVGPALLYLALRRVSRSMVGLEQDAKAKTIHTAFSK